MLNINNISSKSDKFQDLPFVFRDLISLLTEKLSEKRQKIWEQLVENVPAYSKNSKLSYDLNSTSFFQVFQKDAPRYLYRNFQRFNSESFNAGANKTKQNLKTANYRSGIRSSHRSTVKSPKSHLVMSTKFFSSVSRNA